MRARWDALGYSLLAHLIALVHGMHWVVCPSASAVSEMIGWPKGHTAGARLPLLQTSPADGTSLGEG